MCYGHSISPPLTDFKYKYHPVRLHKFLASIGACFVLFIDRQDSKCMLRTPYWWFAVCSNLEKLHGLIVLACIRTAGACSMYRCVTSVQFAQSYLSLSFALRVEPNECILISKM